MKYISFILSFFAATVFLLLFTATSAEALIITSEKNVSVPADQIVDDDLFISGESVFIDGTVNGDVYAAGGVVRVTGDVNGDVIAAGGMLEISGTVADDVRVAGGNIVIEDAFIGDNLTVFGGNVAVSDESEVGGSLIFAGGNLISGANVGRGLLGGGGNVTIRGVIGKDVRLGAGKITLGPQATVLGDLLYSSEEDITIDNSATVSGSVKQIFPEARRASADVSKGISKITKGLLIGLKLWSFFASLLVGLLLIKFLPGLHRDVTNRISEKTFESLGWGFLVLLVFGPLFVILSLTLIALPLALILLAFFLITTYLSKIFVSFVIGKKVLNRINKDKQSPYITLTLGMVLYYILSMVPVLSVFVSLITVTLGLGAVFLYEKNLLSSKN